MSQLTEEFYDFHAANPDVFAKFSEYAYELISRGCKKFSSDAILHRVRWHLKLNDHFTAHYARMWLAKNPKHPKFFELRKVTA